MALIIHVLDGQTDEILEDFDSDKGELFSATRTHNLDGVDTVDISFNSRLDKAKYLTKRARIIVPIEDGKLMEYVITNTAQLSEGRKDVFASASYVDLAGAKVIKPNSSTTEEVEG